MIHLLAAIAASLFLIATAPGQAADISVASSPSIKEVLDDLGPKFAALSAHRVSVQYLIPDTQIERGEAALFFTAPSNTRMANLRRDSARRSYRSTAANWRAIRERMTANFFGSLAFGTNTSLFVSNSDRTRAYPAVRTGSSDGRTVGLGG